MPVRLIYYFPRILSVGFVLFLAIFLAEGFDLEHLMPALSLLVVVLIAWKFDIIGLLAFLGFSVWYIFSIGFDKPWSWYAFIAGLPAITGFFYLLSWVQKQAED